MPTQIIGQQHPMSLSHTTSLYHRVRLCLLVCAFTLSGLLFTSYAHAQALQPIPPLNALVVDQANILDANQKTALIQKLLAFEKAKGSQIAILTIPTTAPEDISAYAQRAAETYKLGRQGVGDGVLIVVASNDRKVWVYVMRHLEGAIPDLAAKRVIAETISPAFKQGQYAAGLDAGTNQLMGLIDGEALPPPKANTANNAGDSSFFDLIILVGVLSIIGSNIANATNRWLIAPPAGGVAGLIAYSMTSVLFWGLGAGLVVLILVLIFGSRSFQIATQRSSNNRNNDIFWGGGMGGGGWGGSGGMGGGWGGSGGGGDAGGGGAGGSW